MQVSPETQAGGRRTRWGVWDQGRDGPSEGQKGPAVTPEVHPGRVLSGHRCLASGAADGPGRPRARAGVWGHYLPASEGVSVFVCLAGRACPCCAGTSSGWPGRHAVGRATLQARPGGQGQHVPRRGGQAVCPPRGGRGPGRVEVQVRGPVGVSAWGLGSRGFPPGRAVHGRGPRVSVQLQGRGVAVARLWCWFPCSVTLHRRVPRTRQDLTWVPGLWGGLWWPRAPVCPAQPPAPSHPPLLPAPCSGDSRCPLPVQPGDGAHARHRVPDSGKGSVAGSDSFPCPPPPGTGVPSRATRVAAAVPPQPVSLPVKRGHVRASAGHCRPSSALPGVGGRSCAPCPRLGVWPGLPTAGRGAVRPGVAVL